MPRRPTATALDPEARHRALLMAGVVRAGDHWKVQPRDPGGDDGGQWIRDDLDDSEVRALDGDEFEAYWTRGKGLARWRSHPHPWTRLRNLLRKHVGPGRAERIASSYFHKVFGYWPGHRKGENPVGPG